MRNRDQLIKSSYDTIQLVREIEPRFLEVVEQYGRRWGIPIKIPNEIKRAIVEWRKVKSRHKLSDYRHSLSEWDAIKTVAQWTCDQMCLIRNQSLKKIVWEED